MGVEMKSFLAMASVLLFVLAAQGFGFAFGAEQATANDSINETLKNATLINGTLENVTLINGIRNIRECNSHKWNIRECNFNQRDRERNISPERLESI